MKKIKLFSLVAATLFAGSTMAQTVTYSYTVSEAISKNTRTATTGGFITFGADKFETKNEILAYKLDGDISASSTKYVLVEPTTAFKEGDVIKVGGFGSSNNACIGIFAQRADNESAIATHTMSKTNTTEYLTYTVKATDAIIGKNQLYIFRSSVSSYFLSVEITSALAAAKDDATLKSITVNDEEIEGFAPETTTYNVELPFGTTTVPVVAATATSAKATVSVTQATAVDGTATIMVTAEDGIATKTYTVKFTVAESQSEDATLASISIDGTAIADFKADSLYYTHTIAYTATTIPVIAAEANDASASVSITQADAVPGTATIVVTAQAGNKQTYTVAINRAAAIKHLTVVPFTNGAKGAIDETALTVTAPYLDGTDVPTVDGKNIAVSGDGTPTATLSEDGATITLKGADDVEADYTVVTKALTPETLTAEVITFTGAETYIYAPYGWASDKGIKFAKKVNDEANMRDAKGNTRIYMALPPAENVILTSGTGGARAVVITVNGVASTVTETAASGSTITIALNQSTNNFVAIESNQAKGDGGFTKMQLTSPKDPVGAALNQVQAEVKAVKVIRGGQLLIIREGKTYTAQGVELQ